MKKIVCILVCWVLPIGHIGQGIAWPDSSALRQRALYERVVPDAGIFVASPWKGGATVPSLARYRADSNLQERFLMSDDIPLDDRERMILGLRCFADPDIGRYTLDQLGKVLGMTRERARAIEKNALYKAEYYYRYLDSPIYWEAADTEPIFKLVYFDVPSRKALRVLNVASISDLSGKTRKDFFAVKGKGSKSAFRKIQDVLKKYGRPLLPDGVSRPSRIKRRHVSLTDLVRGYDMMSIRALGMDDFRLWIPGRMKWKKAHQSLFQYLNIRTVGDLLDLDGGRFIDVQEAVKGAGPVLLIEILSIQKELRMRLAAGAAHQDEVEKELPLKKDIKGLVEVTLVELVASHDLAYIIKTNVSKIRPWNFDTMKVLSMLNVRTVGDLLDIDEERLRKEAWAAPGVINEILNCRDEARLRLAVGPGRQYELTKMLETRSSSEAAALYRGRRAGFEELVILTNI